MKALRLVPLLLMTLFLLALGGGAHATTITAWSSTDPAGVGQSVNLFGSVTGINPTGTVTFKDGTVTLGTVTLDNSIGSSTASAMFTTTFSTAGSHSINVRYNGDGNDAAVAKTFTLVVNAKATTTTSLSVTPNPVVKGQSVTLSSRVDGNAPNGTVTFKDGATVIDTVALGGTGVASLTISYNAIGSHSLTAVYNGDAQNYTSTSSTVTLNVVGSQTALTVNPNPALAGQTVNLAATVSGNAPTGAVTFKDGTATLGTASLNASGIATFSTAFTVLGNHSLTAVYGGDANNPGSTSAATTLAVASTVTQLTASPNPAGKEQVVNMVATVSGNAPTGTVTFKSNGTSLGTAAVNASGVATFSTTYFKNGNFTLTAVYGGDANNGTSTSNNVALVVQPDAVTTTTLSATPNPLITGQAATLTAVVTGNAPTGQVNFRDGGQNLGSATLNASGVATLSKVFSITGVHSITALYNGDAKNGNSASAAVALNVTNKTISAITLGATPNPVMRAHAVALVATVTGTAPTGTVTFSEGATVLGSATLDASGLASLTTTFATDGNHSVTAAYAGDGGNTSATSSAFVVTVIPPPASSTALTVAPNPAMAEQAFELAATVSGSNPTGTVTFKTGSTILGTAVLDATFTARLTTSLAQAGSYPLVASYGGDLDNGASDSAAVTLQVNPRAVTTVTLAATPNPVTVEQMVTLTATVSGNAPSGNVVFQEGATVLGAVPLDASGTATLVVSFASAGARNLTASYGGDVYNAGSTASAVSLAVNPKATTTVVLMASANPVMAEQALTLTASVIGNAPTGPVVFRDGSVVLGQGTLDGAGTATLVLPFVVTGAHALRVEYAGDAFNLAGTSANVALTVTPPLCQ